MDFLQAWIAGGEAGKQQRTDRALRQNLQGALGGDQSAQTAVFQADPSMGLKAQEIAQQRQQQAQQDAIAKLHNVSRMYANAPESMRPAMYQHARGLLEQGGIVPPGTLPPDLTNPEDQDGFGKLMASFDPQATQQQRWDQETIPDPNDPNSELVVLRNGDHYKNLDGSPLQFGQQQPSMPTQSPVQQSGDFNSLRAAVMQQESGGNPKAVSPKGAVGRMQTMPGTLRDPGFGVMPARDNTDAELTRVGTDYLQAMVSKYGDTRLALAAYNWGPGNVDAAMKRYGGNVDAVIATAPKETRNYVASITGKVGGGRQAPATSQSAPLSFRRPRFKPGEGRNAPSGYTFNPDGSLTPIKGGPADRKANPIPADMAQGEMAMRKEITALVAPHRTVIQQYDKLKFAAAHPSAANDLSMIFSYMKMLDPGSVVREQEFANAQNAAGVPDRVRNAYNKMLSGERLNPNQRSEFLQAAQGLADTSEKAIQQVGSEYSDIASQYGYDPVRATGIKPKAPPPAAAKPAAPRQTTANDPLGIL